MLSESWLIQAGHDVCRCRQTFFDGNLPLRLVLLLLLTTTMTPPTVRSASVVGSRRRNLDVDEVPRDCPPVPHDTLWLRLNLEPQLPPVVLPEQSPPIAHNYNADNDADNPTSTPDPAAAAVDEVDRPSRRRRRQTVPESQPDAAVKDAEPSADSRRRTRTDQQRQHRRQQRHRKTQQTPRDIDDDRPPKPTRRRKAEIAASLSSGEAWQCHMETFWQRMPEGTFPPYVQTGRCVQRRCMQGLYECRPRKYATRVLRRVDGRCNPLPLVGATAASTGFEEAWVVEEYHVIVGCECSKKRVSGWYEQIELASKGDV